MFYSTKNQRCLRKIQKPAAALMKANIRQFLAILSKSISCNSPFKYTSVAAMEAQSEELSVYRGASLGRFFTRRSSECCWLKVFVTSFAPFLIVCAYKNLEVVWFRCWRYAQHFSVYNVGIFAAELQLYASKIKVKIVNKKRMATARRLIFFGISQGIHC